MRTCLGTASMINPPSMNRDRDQERTALSYLGDAVGALDGVLSDEESATGPSGAGVYSGRVVSQVVG
jgi:hypothetical protein